MARLKKANRLGNLLVPTKVKTAYFAEITHVISRAASSKIPNAEVLLYAWGHHHRVRDNYSKIECT